MRILDSMRVMHYGALVHVFPLQERPEELVEKIGEEGREQPFGEENWYQDEDGWHDENDADDKDEMAIFLDSAEHLQWYRGEGIQ